MALQPQLDSYNVFKQLCNLKKMATVGEEEGCERGNAAKLEPARERDYTGMESRECIGHG